MAVWKRREARLVVALIAALAAAVPATITTPAAALLSASASTSDFDGDGRDDLPIPVSWEDVGGQSNAGAIHVLYRQVRGYAGFSDQTWTHDTSLFGKPPNAGDVFGVNWAAGDFDNDGYDDLAVGAPFEDFGAATDAGGVHVLRGTTGGLTGVGAQHWHQNVAGVAGSNETADHFGTVLAAGDFNGDGRDDLAVGASTEQLGSNPGNGQGAVTVLYGAASGLVAAGSQLIHQDGPGIEGTNEPSDHFGQELTSGDFDGNGFDDLAIGVPDEDVGAQLNAGDVQVIYGSVSGLSPIGDQVWHQGTPLVEGWPESGDAFGNALAAGDFNNDGRHDLAVGVNREDTGLTDVGAVQIFYSDAGGVSAIDHLLLESTLGGYDEFNDHFGSALAAGDFNGDGADDLAASAVWEGIGATAYAGIVMTVPGTPWGLLPGGAATYSQDTPNVPDTAEPSDWFGAALTSLDWDGDGKDDLAVAVQREDLGGVADTGGLQLLLGTATGFAPWTRLLHQDSYGITDSNETGDEFGT